jgi:hypothetical protein
MTLILRTMNKHAQLMGWGDHWGEDDFVIVDEDGRSVARIYKDSTSPRWIWSVNTSPFLAPPQRLGSNACQTAIQATLSGNEGAGREALRMTGLDYKFTGNE